MTKHKKRVEIEIKTELISIKLLNIYITKYTHLTLLIKLLPKIQKITAKQKSTFQAYIKIYSIKSFV